MNFTSSGSELFSSGRKYILDRFSPVLPGTVLTDLEVEALRVKELRFHLWHFHKNIEKKAEGLYLKDLPGLFKTLNKQAVFHFDILYALAVEKLADCNVPVDLNYVRTLIAEMERIAFHIYTLIRILRTAGEGRAEYQFLREYEKIERLVGEFGAVSGDEHYVIPGGLNNHLRVGFLERALKTFEEVERKTGELKEEVLNNRILCSRFKGVGAVPPETAEDFGLTGVNLRASGGNFDLRRQFPYLAYNRLEFFNKQTPDPDGDVFSRVKMRFTEIEQSFYLLRQVTAKLFFDRIQKALSNIKPLKIQKNETAVFVEGPNGLMGLFLKISDNRTVERFQVITPSLRLLSLLERICAQVSFNEFRLIYRSMGISESEAER